MGLLTRCKEGHIKEEAVVCYKLYNKVPGGMKSPWALVEYNLKPGDVVEATGKGTIRSRASGLYYKLENGFLHAYMESWRVISGFPNCFRDLLMAPMNTKEEQEKLMVEVQEAIDALNKEMVVAEMEIPAGERYWLGVGDEVCARRMIYKGNMEIKPSVVLEWILGYRKKFNKEESEAHSVLSALIEEYKAKGQ